IIPEHVWFLFHFFEVCMQTSECNSTKVKGQTGQDVTLSCKYDRKSYGALSVCWGRGEIPSSGCYNQLIATDGYRVETRASSRYELLGRLEDGDVSLTILNLTEGDAGRYGCRVKIPGWFNDKKHHFDLTVVTALSEPRLSHRPALHGSDGVFTSGLLVLACSEAVRI
uniref:Ig-like domain-containing protein n=1 Tax=Amphilophus citrinellus TaxID=61819 RepID=A0A3Q0RDN2_AMPCI